MLIKIVVSTLGVFSKVLGLSIVFFLVARALGPSGFGRFALYFSIAALLSLPIEYGHSQRLLKDFASKCQRVGGLRFRIIVLKFFIFIFIFILSLLVVAYSDADVYLWLILFLGCSVQVFGNMFTSCLSAMRMQKTISINSFLSSLYVCIICLWLYSSGYSDAHYYAGAIATQQILYLFFTLVSFSKKSKIVYDKISVSNLIEELRLSFSYASDVFVMRSFSYIDVVILSVFCSPIQVGIYQAGQKLVQGVLPLAQAINNVVLPKVSVSKNVSWSSYVLFFKIMSFVGFVGFMGFVFFGDSVVLLVFGSKYQDLLSYMPFFGIIVFLRYSNFSSSIFLTALGSQKERVLVNFLSMLVFLVLTPVLVSEYAIKGLLISLVSVSLMTGVLYRFNIKKLLSKVRYDSK